MAARQPRCAKALDSLDAQRQLQWREAWVRTGQSLKILKLCASSVLASGARIRVTVAARVGPQPTQPRRQKAPPGRQKAPPGRQKAPPGRQKAPPRRQKAPPGRASRGVQRRPTSGAGPSVSLQTAIIRGNNEANDSSRLLLSAATIKLTIALGCYCYPWL